MSTNRPAFPQDDYYDEKLIGQQPGMTLRDYFAAAAIDRAVDVIAQFVTSDPNFKPGERKLSEIRDRAATLAFSIADAMIAERGAKVSP